MPGRGFTAFALVLTLAAPRCGNEEHQAGIFFPTAGGSGRPSALLEGTLIEQRRCVFVRHQGGRLALVLWHDEYSARRAADGTLEIVTEDGAVAARVGDRVEIGGGFVGEAPGETEFPETFIEEPIPERCRADGYWLGAEVTSRGAR